MLNNWRDGDNPLDSYLEIPLKAVHEDGALNDRNNGNVQQISSACVALPLLQKKCSADKAVLKVKINLRSERGSAEANGTPPQTLR